MSSICILTDSAIQFSQPSFPGRNLVHILPLSIEVARQARHTESNLRVNDLPLVATDELQPRLLPPTPESFRKIIKSLEQSYDEILAIFTSSNLCPIIETAQEAIKNSLGRTRIQFIDSQTTSIGLGILVQATAEAGSRGENLTEAERLARQLLPHIYATICATSPSYLHYAGILDFAQAQVAEMLGLQSIYSMEEGRLSPVMKVRSTRQVYDYFQEFLDEFDNVKHIGLMQSFHHSPSESRLLREHAQSNFNHSPFTEHGINLPVALLFGPSATCLFIVEDPLRSNRIS